MKLKKNLLLIAIIALSAVLRFYNLSNIPAGFNDDEAAFGYNAYSITKIGKDEWGKMLPFPVFESFGDWKLVGYLYLTAISTSIFGLSEFATRFPSALFGVFTVFATYLLAKELFNKRIALLASLLIAISPWHVIASRNAFESDLLSFFITLGIYALIKAFEEKKYLKYSGALFVLAFYIYRSAWIFLPLFLLTILLLHQSQFRKFKKEFLKYTIIGIVFLLPLIPTIFSFRGQSRFVQESFITGATRIGITNDINIRRGLCSNNMPTFTCTIIYNKYISFTKTYVANYFKNLSFDSFFENASPTGFQSFATRGVFYLFELPLLILGLLVLFKRKDPSLKILIPWILLAPIGASITGIGNYGRLNLILPVPQIIAAFGLYAFLTNLNLKALRLAAIATITIVITFSLCKFVVDMFYVEPFFTSRYQRYGYKELFTYLNNQKSSYEHFYISGKIDNSHQYIQYLFHQKVDPQYFLSNVKRSHAKDGWVSMESIANYHFPQSAPGPEQIPKKSLLVTGSKEVNYPVGPISQVKYLNGEVGFEVYDVDSIKAANLKQDK